MEVNRWQGVVGAQSRGMGERLTRTEDAVNATQQMLSQVKDSDYTEAVTKFQQAQTALQASIMTGSQLMNLSLLEFLR
jgi:flagellar hook-associated protein 3 FlgL